MVGFAREHSHFYITSKPLVFHGHVYKRPFTGTHYLFLLALIIHRSPAGKAKNPLRITPEAEQGCIVVNSRKELKLETTHKNDKRMIFQKPRFPLNSSTQMLFPKHRDVNTFRGGKKKDSVA